MSEFNHEELSNEYDSHKDEKEIILNDLKDCFEYFNPIN